MKWPIVYEPESHKLSLGSTDVHNGKSIPWWSLEMHSNFKAPGYVQSADETPRWSNIYEVSLPQPSSEPSSEPRKALKQYVGTVKLNSLPLYAVAMRYLGLVERHVYVRKGTHVHLRLGGS